MTTLVFIKATLDEITAQLDKMKAKLKAQLASDTSSLSFNKDAAKAIQELLDSMFQQVLPPLDKPASQIVKIPKYSVECGTDFITVDLSDQFQAWNYLWTPF